MLHSPIDKNKLDDFYLKMKSNAIVFGDSITVEDINLFEQTNDIALPQDLKYNLLNLNGFADNEIFEMSRFWRLDEYKKVTKYFGSDILRGNNESLNSTVYNQLMTEQSEWLLLEPGQYYLFADYNINGSYWAIKMKPEIYYVDTPIISISDTLNLYRKVADSFTEFVSVFFEDGPEGLL